MGTGIGLRRAAASPGEPPGQGGSLRRPSRLLRPTASWFWRAWPTATVGPALQKAFLMGSAERRDYRDELSPPACSPKNRISSAVASGPRGSVYEPLARPPHQA